MSEFGNIEDELSRLTNANYPPGYFEPRCAALRYPADSLTINLSYGDGRRLFHPELLVVAELGILPIHRFKPVDEVAEALWEVFSAAGERECHDWLSGGILDKPLREVFGRHGVRYVVNLKSTYGDNKAVLTCSVTEAAITSLFSNPGFMLPKRKNLDGRADVAKGTLRTLAHRLTGALSPYVTN